MFKTCPEQSRRKGRSPVLTSGAYSQYVSANAAKSGKSVSPKVRKKGDDKSVRAALAKPENAAGGFFQHSLSLERTLRSLPSTPEEIQQHLERQERELDAARRISQALFQHLHVEDLVKQALEIALDVVDGQAGCVLLAESDAKQLVFYHTIGEKPPTPGKGFPWDKGIAGSVFQLGDPIVTRDAKHDQRHFPAIDEATGYSTHDMIALPLKSWAGRPIGVLEVINKKDGKLNQDDVAILTIISAFTAISIEQARLFEEAKLAEVARVLGDIGHDVKNLLMPVLCGASLLKEEVDEFFLPLPDIDLGKAQASHHLCLEVIGMLERNTHRIQDRVKDIADCVKGLSSPPVFGPCNIALVIDSVFDALRLPAQEKGIVLAREGLETLPGIEADEGRLFNAFYNLVNNAVPEVPEGGSIVVRGIVDPSAGGLKLAVVDTGKGMPAEIRESLFSPKALSSKAGGTGLGTKIVKDVVDAHGGTITVESEIGLGTTFHLYLPLKPPRGVYP